MESKRKGLVIHCNDKQLQTNCTGCPCHWDSRIRLGDVNQETCPECGCPKTVAAFERALQAQEQR